MQDTNTHGKIKWQTGNHMTDMEQDMNKPNCDRDKTKTWHLVYILYKAAPEKIVMSLTSSVQLSYNGVNAGRSRLLLNIKCTQC